MVANRPATVALIEEASVNYRHECVWFCDAATNCALLPLNELVYDVGRGRDRAQPIYEKSGPDNVKKSGDWSFCEADVVALLRMARGDSDDAPFD